MDMSRLIPLCFGRPADEKCVSAPTHPQLEELSGNEGPADQRLQACMLQ